MDKPKYLATAERIEKRVEFLVFRVGTAAIAFPVAACLLDYWLPWTGPVAEVIAYTGLAFLFLTIAIVYIGLPYASILRNVVSPFLDGGTTDERRVAIARMVLVAGLIGDFALMTMSLLTDSRTADAVILPYLAVWMFCGCSLALPGATEWLARAKRQEH